MAHRTCCFMSAVVIGAGGCSGAVAGAGEIGVVDKAI